MSMNTLKKTEATGKNINEAKAKAAELLGVDEEQIKFEVLENATSGFLGMGAKPCKIAAWVSNDAGAKAEEFLNRIIPLIGANATVTATETDDALNVTMEGEKMGLLIGRRGETLDALQYLTSIVVNKGRDEYMRVTLDTENYREKRKEVLEKLANKIADKVVRNRRNMTLEPMNPFERRIIHAALQNHEYVTTSSIGEEPERRVVVSLKR